MDLQPVYTRPLNWMNITGFRSSRPEVLYKKVFLKISQNSQENTCAAVSF